MKFSLSLSSVVAAVTIALYTGVAASPAPVAEPVPAEDWKSAVGWDGVVLESSAVGSVSAFKNATTDALEKRNIGGVYICTDINWGGTCGYAVQPINECIVLGSDWAYKISSFGPDKGTTCSGALRKPEPFCGEARWWFTYPGDATGGLGTGDPWNDAIGAFTCKPSQSSTSATSAPSSSTTKL
ncbi:hypothetical protein M0805_005521 [Coniferiporia weirii]|nr:hypothetical protein M0805_005521 [Coniferiporia weirii]